MNVWKIGSRWGNLGTSVLDLFINYECVFFGECYGSRIGAWDQVKPEDFFIICDGATPVALGKAIGKFKTYDESGIHFTSKDKEYIYDQVRRKIYEKDICNISHRAGSRLLVKCTDRHQE